jgi:hypothetical protein
LSTGAWVDGLFQSEIAMKMLLLLALGILCWGCAPPISMNGPGARTAVLVGNLHDKNASIRAGAATALGESGPQAREAVPELVKALKDEDESVRKHAGAALKLIDAKAATDAGVR